MGITKKAFVFSFLAFFLAFIIFGLGYAYLQGKTYSKDSDFKSNYLKQSLKSSAYQIIQNISKDKVLLKYISKNQTRLQQLLFSGLKNGTLLTTSIKMNFSNFTRAYAQNFAFNYKGNFNYTVTKVAVYEREPYYLTMLVEGHYSISTSDNFVSWNFNDTTEVSFPIYGLTEPSVFLLNPADSRFKVPFYSVEQKLSVLNDTLKSFNDTLKNMYAKIYFDKEFRYTLGNSYLKSLLNLSIPQYKDVSGYWTFDADEEMESVIDYSTTNVPGKHFGNTYLLFKFDNTTSLGTKVKDSSAYQNNGTLNNGVAWKSSSNCIEGNCLGFDGVDDYISIPNAKFDLSFTNNLTIAGWINPSSYGDTVTGRAAEIFRYGSGAADVISLRINNSGQVRFEMGDHGVVNSYVSFLSNKTLSLNRWAFLVVTFNGSDMRMYINGKFDSMKVHKYIPSFSSSLTAIGLGQNTNQLNLERFTGLLDEFAVYTKPVSDTEIALLYKQQKGKMIDYVDTLHGQGLYFDGKKHFANVSLSGKDGSKDSSSIEFWLKPELDSTATTQQGILIFSNNIGTAGIKFFLNNAKQLQWNIGNTNALQVPYSLNEWNYYVATFDGTNSLAKLYRDGKLVSSINLAIPMATELNVSLNSVTMGWKATNMYYKGTLDEVKVYKRILSPEEILAGYYNYDSVAKGCCNYLMLINPNMLGYNVTAYKRNASFSLPLFKQYFIQNNPYNITLYNITNITTYNPLKKYTNFVADECLVNAFNMRDYGSGGNPGVKLSHWGKDYANCSYLIKKGFY